MNTNSQIQETLLDELGLSGLPQDKKEQLVIKMTEAILKRIFLETIDKLDDQGKEEYEKMVTNGASSRQMEEFLNSKIQNYDALVQKAVEDFKSEMKNSV